MLYFYSYLIQHTFFQMTITPTEKIPPPFPPGGGGWRRQVKLGGKNMEGGKEQWGKLGKSVQVLREKGKYLFSKKAGVGRDILYFLNQETKPHHRPVNKVKAPYHWNRCLCVNNQVLAVSTDYLCSSVVFP